MKMLDHQKMMLMNLNHNKRFFIKELKKSFNLLSYTEVKELEIWLLNNISDRYDLEVELLFRKTKTSGRAKIRYYSRPEVTQNDREIM